MLPIGAASPAGGHCSFSASEGVALWAPGCEIEFADPFSDEFVPTAWVQGTSQASVITSAALTALMSYQPTLTVAQAENDLLQAAGPSHSSTSRGLRARRSRLGRRSRERGDPPRTNTTRQRRYAPPALPSLPPCDHKASSCKHQEHDWYHRRLHLVLSALPAGDRVHARALRQAQVTLRRQALPHTYLSASAPCERLADRHGRRWPDDQGQASWTGRPARHAPDTRATTARRHDRHRR